MDRLPRVHLLPQQVRRLIAAGEVVERPASVVRELIENAIDAGAAHVRIDLRGGGIASIRVADDGCGIHPDDLRLAVEHGATSKIRDAAGLHAIATMGFRGEALAAIRLAAGSLRLASRPRGAEAGAAITCREGRAMEVESCGMAPGTVVEVRDLFAHLPARRRFLGSPKEEEARCLRVAQEYAIAAPHVAFTVTADGRRVFATPGTGHMRAAAAAVWGREAWGLLELAADDGAARVQGLMSPPYMHRGRPDRQLVAVRGRPVQAPTLLQAAEDAWRRYLVSTLQGRRPWLVLVVQLPPEGVDANVHPQKLVVRIRQEEAVRELIARAVHAAIGAGVPPAGAAAPPPRQASAGATAAVAAPMAQGDAGHGPRTAPAAHQREMPVAAAVQDLLPQLVPLGQAMATYIVCSAGDAIAIVDQHAAHERALNEEALAALQRHALPLQQLLEPLMVEVPTAERDELSPLLWEMARAGIDVEWLDERTVICRSLPEAVLRRHPPRMAFELLLDGLHRRLPEGIDALAASIACHSAVRAGDPLAAQEMQELLGRLMAAENPLNCPHGRPTLVLLSRQELERRFLR